MCMSSRPRRTSAPIALDSKDLCNILSPTVLEANAVDAKSCLQQGRQSKTCQTGDGYPMDPPKRHVSFFKKVTVQTCLHVNDYTEEEFLSTWYNERELKKIRKSCKRLIHKLNNRMLANRQSMDLYEDSNDSTTTSNHGALCQYPFDHEDEKHCFRGLEGATVLGGYLRQQHKDLAWDEVRCEQHRQWNTLGYLDAEKLSLVYRNDGQTDVSADVAHRWALYDESIARHLHEEEDPEIEPYCRRGMYGSLDSWSSLSIADVDEKSRMKESSS